MELRGFAAVHDRTAWYAGQEDPIGLIVYRLGRHPFTVQRGVRFPLGLFGEPTDNRLGSEEDAR